MKDYGGLILMLSKLKISFGDIVSKVYRWILYEGKIVVVWGKEVN